MTIGSPPIGAKLGPYELRGLLGRGGMSTVYQGFDTNLQRPVAIKVLADFIAEQPQFATRFRQEAQLLAGLRHRHIVQVYDFGEQDGTAYMVQELLAGPTLEQQLADLKQRGAGFSRAQILAIAEQTASALDAAHAAGIIHRDVKPSNIMRDTTGAVVLTDFGVAKIIQDERLTQTGVIIGTPTYLSPEQAQGLPLTIASDIYSLGVVLYELIAGHPPFEGASSIGVALSHVQKQAPSLRRWRADLPPAAEAAVLRALAKRPVDRFGSAGALSDALARAWPAVPAPYTAATIAGWPLARAAGSRPAGQLLPAFAIMLALLAGGAGWQSLRPAADQADAAPTLMVPTFVAADPTSMSMADPTAAPAPVITAEPAAPAPVMQAEPAAPADPVVHAEPTAVVQPAQPAAQNVGSASAPAPAAQPVSDQTHDVSAPEPAQPGPPKPDKPKPDNPRPEQPKPDKPKPDKPNGNDKGGGKSK